MVEQFRFSDDYSDDAGDASTDDNNNKSNNNDDNGYGEKLNLSVIFETKPVAVWHRYHNTGSIWY